MRATTSAGEWPPATSTATGVRTSRSGFPARTSTRSPRRARWTRSTVAPAAGVYAVAGLVHAGPDPGLNGRVGGLPAPGARTFAETSGGLGAAEGRDYCAAAAATGDVNGDSRADLELGAPGEDVGSIA